MRHTRYDCDIGCPVEAALEILGGKWKGAILYHLLDGAKRFNEIQRLKPQLTHRVLTANFGMKPYTLKHCTESEFCVSR